MISTREYRMNMSHWGIDQYAYDELKAFCLQYPQKRKQADLLLGLSAHGNITTYHKEVNGKQVECGAVMPHGNGKSDPTLRTVMMRDVYLRDCDLIERIARETDGGGWVDALILNCCYKVGYASIDPAILPTSHRNAFFRAKREFFCRLFEARLKIGTHGAMNM